MNVDPVNLAVIRGLMANGVVYRHVVGHSWPGCDGRMTCDCPTPRHSYRLADAYRDALEGGYDAHTTRQWEGA